jgi:hypothetical protein
MQEYRKLAAGIDLRMRQLAAEGVPDPALISRMMAHMIELQRIWTSTTDQQLALLCREYPGFYRYASLMEDAAAAESRKPTRSYDGLPEFPGPVKQQLSSLLMGAAKLERDYQSALDAGTGPGARQRIGELTNLYRTWRADLARFGVVLQSPDIPQKSRDIVMLALDRVSQQIAALEARALER